MNWTLRFALSLWTIVGSAHAETVALWLFDDPVGSSVALDLSGNGYHLTLGLDAAIEACGKFGNALNADATDQDGLGAFRYKAEPALNPGDTDWTVECWVKARPDIKNDNRIWGLSGINYIDYGRGNNMADPHVAKRFGRLDTLQVACRYLPLDGVNGWNKPTGDLRADQNYHHFAVVYDASLKQLRHYFDGNHQCTIEGQWHSVYGSDNDAMDRAVFPPTTRCCRWACVMPSSSGIIENWSRSRAISRSWRAGLTRCVSRMRCFIRTILHRQPAWPSRFYVSGLRRCAWRSTRSRIGSTRRH